MTDMMSREIRLASRPKGIPTAANFGWREYFMASPKELHPVSREIQPLSVYLGALGMTGMTAWAGLNLVAVKAGDVIFISGAAGAVGNVAGQLAKLRECRVIGSGGSAEKVEHKETVVEGIDQATGAFLGLFQGQNVGKMVVKLA